MSEKRYFKVEYDEEWYLFDSNTISEELVTEQAEYGYDVFANSLSPSEICERLNEQQSMIEDFTSQLQGLCNDFERVVSENSVLRKENEQLRKQVAEYDMILR